MFDQKLIIDDAVTGLETGLEAPSGKHDSGWWHADRQKNRWSLRSWNWLNMS